MKALVTFIHKITLLGVMFFCFSNAFASYNVEINYLDKNGDSTADAVLIRKGNLVFAGVFEKSKITSFSIRKISDSDLQVTYRAGKNNFEFFYGFATKDTVFKGSGIEVSPRVCLHSKGPGLQNLGDIGNANIAGAPDDCSQEFRNSNKITSALDILYQDSEKNSECISSLSLTAGHSWLFLEDELKNLNLCLVNSDEEALAETCSGVFEEKNKSIYSLRIRCK